MPGSKCPPTNIQTQAVGTYLEIMPDRETQLRLHSKTLSQIMGSVRWLGGLGSLQPNLKTRVGTLALTVCTCTHTQMLKTNFIAHEILNVTSG